MNRWRGNGLAELTMGRTGRRGPSLGTAPGNCPSPALASGRRAPGAGRRDVRRLALSSRPGSLDAKRTIYVALSTRLR